MFNICDIVLVRSRYLKSKAVPSKHLNHNPKKPIEFQRRLFKPASLQNPGEQENASTDYTPRSRRMCFVHGCTTKASEGVFLHSFPKHHERRNAWLHAIKSGLGPKKNSVVCSQHFHDSDYVSGNILKGLMEVAKRVKLSKTFELPEEFEEIFCVFRHNMNI